MEDLIKIPRFINVPKPKITVIPRVTKLTDEQLALISEKKKVHEKSNYHPLLMPNSPLMNIKATLLNANSAKYFRHEDDSFYKLLYAKYKKHSEAMDVEPYMYKKPFDDLQFTFKNAHTKYYDVEGNLCMYEACFNKPVSITLTVHLYTIDDITGMYIRATEVHVIQT